MKLILSFISVNVFLLILSCSTSKNTDPQTPFDMEYTILKTGNMFGAGEEGLDAGVLSATNTEKMSSIVNQINSINQEIKESLITEIHFFDESMLLFIFDKVRGSGGHTLEVINITNTNEAIVVSVKENAPNGPASTVMTQPYVVIQMKSSRLPVQLKVIGL